MDWWAQKNVKVSSWPYILSRNPTLPAITIIEKYGQVVLQWWELECRSCEPFQTCVHPFTRCLGFLVTITNILRSIRRSIRQLAADDPRDGRNSRLPRGQACAIIGRSEFYRIFAENWRPALPRVSAPVKTTAADPVIVLLAHPSGRCARWNLPPGIAIVSPECVACDGAWRISAGQRI